MAEKPDYEAVVDILDTHPDWEYMGNEADQDAALAKAARDGGAELFYRHTETGAELYLSELGHAGLNGHLGQTLDMNLVLGEQTPLKQGLEAAYTRIAEEHATEYTNGSYDVEEQISFTVPPEYDQAELEHTIDAVSAVSRDVQALHEEILAPLKQ
jgi:hypothetical protein